MPFFAPTAAPGTPGLASFRLDPAFVLQYENRTPPFGFNGLGELVYMRTYSRIKPDGSNERWHETVERVVNGTYNMQRRWIAESPIGGGWDNAQAQRSAQEMYDRIWNMKFLPPGRGLWAMGSPLTEERGLYAALNNCAFVSTATLKQDLAEPFVFLMEASMLGIGVGFDTTGAGQLMIRLPKTTSGGGPILHVYDIPDTREGWVESVRMLLESYFIPERVNQGFCYDDIRPAGQPIKGFGGVSAGPEPLQELHESIRSVLESVVGKTLGSREICDIMNLIGKCVVAGNVRRTAEIAFGRPDDEVYLDLKNYKRYPERETYGWTSNNSIFAQLGMDYTPAADRIQHNGEPGFAWLENMRRYGRMSDQPTMKDWRVMGGNPCLEQSLESYELCCLVETFPANHDDVEDFKRTLKFAYLYAKTVTLGGTPWHKTNLVMRRNRRIGCSMSGVVQALSKLGIHELRGWCDEGYKTIQRWDEVYSEWLGIPKSIKTTSIKPSGTVSLLAGATPGMHYPEARHYIRRMRLSRWSELVGPLERAGYKIEAAFGSEESTLVVEIPVRIEEPVRTAQEVSMWEQLALAAMLQSVWADNQVSCTVTFDPETEGPQIAHALQHYQYQLKGISFLPRKPLGAYRQMPYEAITSAEYHYRAAEITKPDFGWVANEAAEVERFCNNDTCEIK